MRSVTYSMNVSLDGYIVGPDGKFDWTAPDEEVFVLTDDYNPVDDLQRDVLVAWRENVIRLAKPVLLFDGTP